MKLDDNNRKISDVCKIIPGAAKSVYDSERDKDGQIAYLLKGVNLDTDGGISSDEMDKVSISTSRNINRYFLVEGDVVVMARGSAVRASIVTKELVENKIIASANFIVLRPNKEIIKGEVIIAYLTSLIGIQKLKSLNRGSVIQHIPTSDLRDMQLPVPPLSIQNQISDIYIAKTEAYKATKELAEQQKNTANAAMLNLMLEVA